MRNHINYWLGVFSAILLGIPIAFGVMSAAQDRFLDAAAVLFGVILTLVALLFAVIFCKDKILTYFFGAIETSTNNLISSFSDVVKSIAKRDVDSAVDSGEKLAVQIANWYVWSNFYRWVISICIGLLAVFATYVGSVLLFEQNNKIKEQTIQFAAQNDLASLNLTNEMRLQLQGVMQIQQEFIHRLIVPSCPNAPYMSIVSVPLYGTPNMSVVNSIISMISTSEWASQITKSMHLLLSDSSGYVVLGALLVLDAMKQEVDDSPIRMRNLYVDDVVLHGKYNLKVEDSVVANIQCDKCDLKIARSVVGEAWSKSVSTTESFVMYDETVDDVSIDNSIVYFEEFKSQRSESQIDLSTIISELTENKPSHTIDSSVAVLGHEFPTADGQMQQMQVQTNPIGLNSSEVCETLSRISQENIFVKLK